MVTRLQLNHRYLKDKSIVRHYLDPYSLDITRSRYRIIVFKKGHTEDNVKVDMFCVFFYCI